MEVRAELYVCTTGRHNKYYFLMERPGGGGVDCFYGRNETLSRGHFSNQIYYTHSFDTQLEKKLRGWRKKGDDYVLIFSDQGEHEWLQEKAVKWAKYGSHYVSKPEPTPAEPVFAGWFNNAKE